MARNCKNCFLFRIDQHGMEDTHSHVTSDIFDHVTSEQFDHVMSAGAGHVSLNGTRYNGASVAGDILDRNLNFNSVDEQTGMTTRITDRTLLDSCHVPLSATSHVTSNPQHHVTSSTNHVTISTNQESSSNNHVANSTNHMTSSNNHLTNSRNHVTSSTNHVTSHNTSGAADVSEDLGAPTERSIIDSTTGTTRGQIHGSCRPLTSTTADCPSVVTVC